MIINTLKQKRRSFYFAHRGAPWVEKENSIMSFCRAIELGCQGLEMDLQITKDKKLIIYHDLYIQKDNKTLYINQLTYFQISKIMKSINNKVVIVTGASKGLGAEICLKLAKEKYKVAIVYKSSTNEAKKILLECQKFSEALLIKADVSKQKSLIFARQCPDSLYICSSISGSRH